MDLVEIDGWVPGDSKTIQISPTSLPAPLDLEVREFSPSEWDVQEVMERIDATSMSHPTPCYAIADVQKTALGIEAFLDSKVSNYIEGLSTETPGLVGETFSHAWSNAHQTQVCWRAEYFLVLCPILSLVCRRSVGTYNMTEYTAQGFSSQLLPVLGCRSHDD